MRMRQLLGPLFGMVLLCGSAAGAGAAGAVALPQGFSLWSASFPDHLHGFLAADDAAACGKGKGVRSWGLIEASQDGGGTWHAVSTLPLIVSSIQMTDASEGWALAGLPAQMCASYVGSRFPTRLLRVSNGGRAWRTAYEAGGYIMGIAPVGSESAYIALFEGHGTGARGALLYTGDGGRHFSTVLRTPDPLFAVSAAGQTVLALAAGAAGKGGNAIVWRSTDGGRRWSHGPAVESNPTFALTEFGGSSLVATSAQTAWLGLFAEDSCAMHGCDVSNVYRSVDGGRTWQMEPSAGVGCVITAPLIAASGQDALTVSTQNLGACSGAQSAILESTDGGPFHLRFSSARAEITAIGFIPGGGVYALTSRSLYVSRNSARSWTVAFPKQP